MPSRPPALASPTTFRAGAVTLHGTAEDGVLVFRGVPYARAARFAAPERLPLTGEIDATRRGPRCPQPANRLAFVMGEDPEPLVESEACQVISIFTPDPTGALPVVVWLHGGAYLVGGGEQSWYDGARLARDGGVVVVSVTYRLGAFGFLAGATSNPGLRDQAAALEWVRENIAHFGGDPGNVTLVGQSAGGHSVQALMEHAPALFHRAIIQSSPAAFRLSPDQAAAVRGAVDDLAGDSLASLTASELLRLQIEVTTRIGGGMPFSPVFGESAAHPSARRHDVLIGHTADDALPFVQMAAATRGEAGPPPPEAVANTTRTLFAGPARETAKALRRAGNRVTGYRLDWRPEGSALGCPHCLDLPLLFGDEAAWRGSPMLGRAAWTETDARGRALRRAWGAFARDGTPPAGDETLTILD